jgi:hypothetical protein
MKFIKYIITGILFGIVMSKSEAVSWYRIQEMFRFQSFHMYGIIGTAVLSGIFFTWLIKLMKGKDLLGQDIHFSDKEPGKDIFTEVRSSDWAGRSPALVRDPYLSY